MSAVMGWIVTMQDFTGRLPGSSPKLPKVTRQWFASRGEAEARKAYLRGLNPQAECLINVSPAAFRQGRPKEIKKPTQHGAMDWNR
jgi:hypothetical protein